MKLGRTLKRIEVAWRRFAIRSVCLLMPRRRSAPEWSSRVHQVLLLRPDLVGDMIVTTSLLRAIATSHETIRLDVLATPANAGVLDHNPHVRSVLLFDRRRPWTWLRLARKLRRTRYDAVVDCMVFSPSLTALLLMLASGAAERIGIGGRRNDRAYSVPVTRAVDPQAHHIEHLASLATAFGVARASFDWRPDIFLSRDELDFAERLWQRAGGGRDADGRATKRLLVNVSAGEAGRRWPAERFTAVLRDTLARWPSLCVLVIGMPRDAKSLRPISEATSCPTSSPGLRHTLALVASADLLLTPETSLVHAASALRTAVVGMYQRELSTRWSPYGTPSRTLASTGKKLSSLRAEPVVAALDELLESLKVGSQP
jgi:ADP-heptose:LPS heptosyltransferase